MAEHTVKYLQAPVLLLWGHFVRIRSEWASAVWYVRQKLSVSDRGLVVVVVWQRLKAVCCAATVVTEMGKS